MTTGEFAEHLRQS